MPDIRHFLVIDAPAKKVYEALTTEKGIAGWWTKETVMRAEVGFTAEFKFGDRYHNKMKIIELQPNTRVAWECLDGDKEWIGTTFTFDLEEQNGKTTLRFGHNDWREATDFYASCNFQWGHYMNSLMNYCETGVGEPFTG